MGLHRTQLAACLVAAFAMTGCAILIPSAPPTSCEGFCGGFTGNCFCDDLCTFFNDCCPDAVELCLAIPPTPPAPPSPPISPSPPPAPITCAPFCGGGTPFGCFCDDLCTLFVDCCPDVGETCGIFAPPPAPPSPPSPPSPPASPPSPPIDPTCDGFCGGFAAPFGCFCDNLCTSFNDCCPDAVELCLSAVSCDGFCGGFADPFGCFCDDLCTAFNDCCPDAIELCLTPPTPPDCPFMPGDANGDGEVSVLDLVTVTNFILGISDEIVFCAADLDSNGVINVTDIVAIVAIIVG